MIEPRHTKMNQKMYLMEKDEGDLMPFSVRSVEDGTAASLSVITSVAWAALLTTTIF